MRAGAVLAPAGTADPALALVRAAQRAARIQAAFRVLECASAAALGAGATAAAGILSGSDVGPELALAGAIGGLCAAAALWIERPPAAAAIVRRADARLDRDGALVAALEGARAKRPTRLQAALVRRIVAQIPTGLLARCALPRTPIALAGPLLGAALVVLALDLRGSAPEAPGAISAGAAGSAHLRAAAAARRAAGDAELAAALETAVARLEAAEHLAPAARSREREAIGEELLALAALLPPGDPARPALDAGRELLAAELAASPRPASPGSPRGGTGPERGTGATGAPAEGSPPGPGGAGAGPGLATGAGDGRMLAPRAEGEPPESPGGPASGAEATGGSPAAASALRWWPSRYDAVVARWLSP